MNNLAKMLMLIGVRVQNNDGSFRSIADIINDLESVWIKLTKEQQDLISAEFLSAVKD